MSISLSPTAAALTNFVGWNFLPSALAKTLINIYHRIFRPGIAPPRPGTPQYAAQYRISFTLLACGYLLYTLISAAMALEPNYYALLSTHRSVDEAGLKTAYRNFARKNHPDRRGVGPEGEDRFRRGRDAYEMLKNPVKRFAYERFGPQVAEWKECATPREYIARGVTSAAGFHIGSAVGLIIMSLLGKWNSTSFWRYLLLAIALSTEAYLVLSPSAPVAASPSLSTPHSLPIISTLLPNMLPFQHILFLHQVFVSLSLCFGHLAPILFPAQGLNSMSEKEILEAMSGVIQRISMVGAIAEREISRMIQTELRALHGPEVIKSNTGDVEDDPVMKSLTHEMENLLIETRLRSHPVIRSMWDRVVGSGPIKSITTLDTSSSTIRGEHDDTTLLPSVELSPVVPSSPARHHKTFGQPDRALSPPSDTETAISDSGATAVEGRQRSPSYSPPPSLAEVLAVGQRPRLPSSPIRRPSSRAGSERSSSPTKSNATAPLGGARFFPSAFASST